MSYSQNAEEQHILEYFKDQPTGRFLDIGAFDVFKFSNTRALFEKGWGGILVEPVPALYKAIADHYSPYHNIEVLNCAVGDRGGEIDFFESEDAVSTSNAAHAAKWAAGGVQYKMSKVNQVNTHDFFNQYGKGIDFLSIDTEATNIDVFRMIPDWVFEQIKMICIEHDGHEEEIRARLRRFWFMTIYTNAENIILAK